MSDSFAPKSALYVIRNTVSNAFKVGRSTNPERRLKELQTASPDKLVLEVVYLGRGSIEPHIHRSLRCYRGEHRSGEWYCGQRAEVALKWAVDVLVLRIPGACENLVRSFSR